MKRGARGGWYGLANNDAPYLWPGSALRRNVWRGGRREAPEAAGRARGAAGARGTGTGGAGAANDAGRLVLGSDNRWNRGRLLLAATFRQLVLERCPTCHLSGNS